ncbi:hypothetical protein AB0A74_36605 [Saccharothrix sp. NPDC042600]|uniref:hypothetical protein n=1 Tax=Saccharothrix TaxID=2071 RepID=UPI0033C7E9A1|nr:hypothetical protein GCM10017745_39440 [Saccharothrix mutabilis subsp. capreolus]
MANGGDEGDGARTAQTGVASGAGIVVQAGGDVTFVHNGSSLPGAGPVRGPSASGGPRSSRPMYLRQVDRIAAPRLLDRERELAELEDFCLREDRGPYMWWQAGPWAGKSALLAAFVLDPPKSLAGRVWLVSFFVTARLAAQDTSDAFTTAVTTQLCELLGEEPALGVDESVRELLLLDLLSRAAATCRAAGGRLVLVVDGLDEDRCVTAGPHAHSIAALLPGRPEHGMRVVVAGRPNPPIPDDVPDWHPLRDAAVVRPLSGSAHARDRQRLGQSELKRLLRGGPVEQDVLGLLTAARGGLSLADLRVLTGADLVEVEDVLHTVAGRTFTRRPGIAGPDVYLLGHEELHTAACDYLGPERLADYRARLFAWADGYLAPGAGRAPWPPETPEYLVTGYPRMLATIGDAHRLTALATDRVRHDRMLDVSGGDAAALVEITTCQDLTARRAGRRPARTRPPVGAPPRAPDPQLPHPDRTARRLGGPRPHGARRGARPGRHRPAPPGTGPGTARRRGGGDGRRRARGADRPRPAGRVATGPRASAGRRPAGCDRTRPVVGGRGRRPPPHDHPLVRAHRHTHRADRHVVRVGRARPRRPARPRHPRRLRAGPRPDHPRPCGGRGR